MKEKHLEHFIDSVRVNKSKQYEDVYEVEIERYFKDSDSIKTTIADLHKTTLFDLYQALQNLFHEEAEEKIAETNRPFLFVSLDELKTVVRTYEERVLEDKYVSISKDLYIQTLRELFFRFPKKYYAKYSFFKSDPTLTLEHWLVHKHDVENAKRLEGK